MATQLFSTCTSQKIRQGHWGNSAAHQFVPWDRLGLPWIGGCSSRTVRLSTLLVSWGVRRAAAICPRWAVSPWRPKSGDYSEAVPSVRTEQPLLRHCSMYRFGDECRLSSVLRFLLLKTDSEKATVAPKDTSYTQKKWGGELSTWWGMLSLVFSFCMAGNWAQHWSEIQCGVTVWCDDTQDGVTPEWTGAEIRFASIWESANVLLGFFAHDSCQDSILAKQAAKAFWTAFLQTASNCECSQDIRLKESKQTKTEIQESRVQ